MGRWWWKVVGAHIGLTILFPDISLPRYLIGTMVLFPVLFWDDFID